MLPRAKWLDAICMVGDLALGEALGSVSLMPLADGAINTKEARARRHAQAAAPVLCPSARCKPRVIKDSVCEREVKQFPRHLLLFSPWALTAGRLWTFTTGPEPGRLG